MNNPTIVLTGPTASGKTALSLSLAKKLDCEIICADSMTVYRGMDVGTDKPKLRHSEPCEESRTPEISLDPSLDAQSLPSTRWGDDEINSVDGIPHHLLNIVNPDEEFNVAIFVKKAKEAIADIQSRGKIPLLVGGSVMYIDALIYDYQMPEVAPNPELRAELATKSTDELFARLCELDPDCEWTVDRHNRRRLIRAIEVCSTTGKSLAEQKNRKSLPENVIYLAIDRDREDLYGKINSRVDQMFRNGFVEEVKALRQKYDDSTALQAAGYRQICEYLDGKIDLKTAIEKTKQVHRNYAKRQLTWLRRNEDVKWIQSASEAEKMINSY